MLPYTEAEAAAMVRILTRQVEEGTIRFHKKGYSELHATLGDNSLLEIETDNSFWERDAEPPVLLLKEHQQSTVPPIPICAGPVVQPLLQAAQHQLLLGAYDVAAPLLTALAKNFVGQDLPSIGADGLGNEASQVLVSFFLENLEKENDVLMWVVTNNGYLLTNPYGGVFSLTKMNPITRQEGSWGLYFQVEHNLPIPIKAPGVELLPGAIEELLHGVARGQAKEQLETYLQSRTADSVNLGANTEEFIPRLVEGIANGSLTYYLRQNETSVTLGDNAHLNISALGEAALTALMGWDYKKIELNMLVSEGDIAAVNEAVFQREKMNKRKRIEKHLPFNREVRPRATVTLE